MRKLVNLALVLALGIAQADAATIITCGALCARGYGFGINPKASSYTGPGDIVSSPWASYGLRAYTAAYANAGSNLVNLRNTSTNETCDIPAVATGGFGLTKNCTIASNGVSASTFCTPGCAVVTLYDQSGNGRNLTQATTGSQPPLTLSCTGSLPCVNASAGSTCLSVSGITSISQPVTISAVAVRTGNFTTQINLLTGANGSVFNPSANHVAQYYGSFPNATASDSVIHALQFVGNGASSTINVDGTNTNATAGSGTFPNSTSYGIMAQTSVCSSTATMKFFEGSIWNSALSTTQQNNVCHNQTLYWGLGGSC